MALHKKEGNICRKYYSLFLCKNLPQKLCRTHKIEEWQKQCLLRKLVINIFKKEKLQ